MSEQLLSSDLQYGAFAICLALLAVFAWYLRYSTKNTGEQFKMIQTLQSETNEVLRATHETINHSTAAIEKLAERHDRDAPVLRDIRDRLLERPCLRDKEKKGS